jgi:hypothetical protein
MHTLTPLLLLRHMLHAHGLEQVSTGARAIRSSAVVTSLHATGPQRRPAPLSIGGPRSVRGALHGGFPVSSRPALRVLCLRELMDPAGAR